MTIRDKNIIIIEFKHALNKLLTIKLIIIIY